MLQSFRDNLKGVTAAILVGILIIPFAFFGVESLFVSGSSVEQAAAVNGAKITQLEVERGVEFQKQRILSQFDEIDPSLVDEERLWAPVLDQLIRQKLLTVTAAEGGMAVPDQTFNEIILATEAFQRDDGTFDEALYEYHLRRLGFTPLGYRENVKQEILASHLTAGLQSTAFATDAQLEDFGRLALQQRSFDYIALSPSAAGEVDVTDEEIRAYYEEHAEALTEPDQVVIDYIELTPQLLESRVEVSEEAVAARIAQSRSQTEGGGKAWRLAHIQVGESGEETQQTVETIEQRLAAGEAFADLAREYSADFGSAEAGGELGTFTAQALPPGFGDAIAELETGEVAGPVELESGVHFIKVLDIVEAEDEGRALSRDVAEAQVRAELAREQLPVVLEQLKEETFSVDALAPVGDKLDLPVVTSEPFTAAGGNGIARYPAVAEAAFSEEVLDEGFASQALELEENQYVVIKLKEFIPAHLPPLEKVAGEIRQAVAGSKAQAQVRERAEALLAAVKNGASLQDAAEERQLAVKSETGVTRFDQRVPQALSEAVFEPSLTASLPVTGLTPAANGELYVYAVRKIEPGNIEALSEQERRSMRLSLAQLDGGREFQAYLETLEAGADISRRQSSPSGQE